MELYFSPFARSLAAHMLCKELQLDVRLRRVELRSKRLEDGGSFLDVAPKGQVPGLRDYAQRCADREGAGAAVAYEQALMSKK